MKRFAGMVLVLLLSACSAGKSGPVALSSEAWEVPIANENLIPAPGKSKDDLLAEIVVPPSGKPRKVQIYRRPVGMFAAKAAPRVSVVSDDPAVTVAQPRRWPWWWKGLALLIGLCVGWLVWLKINRSMRIFLSGAWAIIRKLLR